MGIEIGQSGNGLVGACNVGLRSCRDRDERMAWTAEGIARGPHTTLTEKPGYLKTNSYPSYISLQSCPFRTHWR